MKRQLASATLLLLLSACAIRGGPELDRTLIPAAPDNWSARADITTVNDGNADTAPIYPDGWIRSFSDDTLEQAVREAFAHNRNLQSVLAQCALPVPRCGCTAPVCFRRSIFRAG